MLHISPTNLLFLAAKQEPYKKKKKSPSLNENKLKNFLERVQETGPAGRKRSGGKNNRTTQKSKRGDSEVEFASKVLLSGDGQKCCDENPERSTAFSFKPGLATNTLCLLCLLCLPPAILIFQQELHVLSVYRNFVLAHNLPSHSIHILRNNLQP